MNFIGAINPLYSISGFAVGVLVGMTGVGGGSLMTPLLVLLFGKVDPALSLPYRPYHTHNAREPLTPGKIYELDIEIWPTSIVVPAGYRLALTVRGRDYAYPGGSGGRLSNMKNEFTGCGPFLHDDPRDRPIAVFGGSTTIHFGADRENFVLLPIIPPA
jgi:predicted acyl esterase